MAQTSETDKRPVTMPRLSVAPALVPKQRCLSFFETNDPHLTKQRPRTAANPRRRPRPGDGRKRSSSAENVSINTAETWVTQYAALRTIEHDGHKFIVAGGATSQSGVAILHHPDCKCLK